MATSQNGYPAGTKTFVGTVNIAVPGTKTILPVKGGAVATVLLWVATRWHREVEPLVEPGNWGYADRNIRGSETQVSNHASGTAIDLNAPLHPLGTAPAKTMSKAQITAAQRIEADSGGVVRWGGSYTGRQDPMHWEINASPAAVAAFAARITGGAPAAGTSGTTGPVAATEEDDMADPALVRQINEIHWMLTQIKPATDRLEDEDAQTDQLMWAVTDPNQGLRVQVASLQGQLAAMTAAITQLPGGNGLDMASITAVADQAATKAAREALAGLGAKLVG